MKNFLLAVFGLFVALPYAPCLRAEVIDSVSFNPSRLGRYEQLKLTDGLSSEGGVNTQYMTVQSGGTVSVSNAGDYELTRSDVSGSVTMPGTRFNTPDVVMKGGKAGFTQSNKSSLIRRLTQNALKVKADVLEAGTVNVKGDAGNTDYDGNSINVFKLGNNNIPKADASCGRMEWVERTASDGKKYKVLAMTGCTEGDEECSPTHNGEESYTETCPTGQTGKITYTWDSASCSYRKLSTCRSNTKKRCLTKALYCGAVNFARGALNDTSENDYSALDECYRYTTGSLSLPEQMVFDITTRTAFSEAGYTMVMPFGCTPGAECTSCTLGEKYVIGNGGWGKNCVDRSYMAGWGSIRELLVFPYAMCAEMDDCSSGTVASCTKWSDAGNTGNPLPFDPSGPELAQP